MIPREVETQLAPARPCRRRNGGIDWQAIERDYLGGLLSLRELAEKHGCSHSTIANFAGRHGWTRGPRVDRQGAGSRRPE